MGPTTGGNLSVTGASTLNGNVTLGNESDTITMTGKLGDVTMNNGATIDQYRPNTLTIRKLLPTSIYNRWKFYL